MAEKHCSNLELCLLISMIDAWMDIIVKLLGLNACPGRCATNNGPRAITDLISLLPFFGSLICE